MGGLRHGAFVAPGDQRKAERSALSAFEFNFNERQPNSYGCINVSADFYDTFVTPAFTATVRIFYILPETKKLEDIFAIKP